MQSHPKPALIHFMDPRSPVVEGYKSLRQNLQFASYGKNIRVMLISSAHRKEGRSTAIANLAIAYAMENRDKRVLVLDADLRNPSQHQLFDLQQSPGLSQFLIDESENDAIVSETAVPNLFLIPSGQVPPNPPDLLSSSRMLELMTWVRQRYDVILIDCPPTLGHADARTLASLCDGVALVAYAGKTKKRFVKLAISSLEKTQANFMGLILNQKKRKGSELLVY